MFCFRVRILAAVVAMTDRHHESLPRLKAHELPDLSFKQCDALLRGLELAGGVSRQGSGLPPKRCQPLLGKLPAQQTEREKKGKKASRL